MVAGIYKITCLANNKIYIGSSQNIFKRIFTHKSTLKRNTHRNKHLQSAWNKFGENSFVFDIIEVVEEGNLIDREQEWINSTKCYDRNLGFNICKLADRPTGYLHTEECKKLMSEIKKDKIKEGLIVSNLKGKFINRKHSEETKEKIRKSKIGGKNPMYGHKEDEEKKKKRMANMLSKPRWNKGLKISDDPRLKKLGDGSRGKIPYNAIKTSLIDNETTQIWTGRSIKELSLTSPISLSSLNRLKNKTAGEILTKKYTIIYEQLD